MTRLVAVVHSDVYTSAIKEARLSVVVVINNNLNLSD
jgi:hypothetical protein